MLRLRGARPRATRAVESAYLLVAAPCMSSLHTQTALLSSVRAYHGGGGGKRPNRRRGVYDSFRGTSDVWSTEQQHSRFQKRHPSGGHHHHHRHDDKQQPPTQQQSPATAAQQAQQPTSFREIDGTAVSALAKPAVHHFQRRQGQMISEPLTVPCAVDDGDNPHGNKKLAILIFDVTSAKRVQAMGKASRRETAVALCYMHALELIEHYTTETNSTVGGGGSGEEQGDSSEEDGEPLPLAIRETLAGCRDQLVHPVRPPSSKNGGAAAPVVSSPHEWTKYIADVAAYLDNKEALIKARHYQTYSIPFDLASMHPLHNTASKELLTWRGLDPACVNRLHNKFQVLNIPLPEITFVRQYGATVASIQLTGAIDHANAGLIAVGVGRNKKDARMRCCAHALEIFRIQETMQREYGVDDNGQPKIRPLCDGLRTLSPSQAKLLEAYLLVGGHSTSSTFRKEDSSYHGGTTKYICRFEIGELIVEGNGINRQEAERAAILMALEELHELDPAFSQLDAFLKQNHQFDPSLLQRLSLSNDIITSANSVIAECKKRLAGCGIGLDLTTTTTSINNSLVDASSTQEEPAERQQQQKISTNVSTPPPPRRGGDEEKAKRMQANLSRLRRDPVYLHTFHPRRSTLAMASVQSQLIEAVEKNQVVILCGTTGCGKTTQVPQYLLDYEIEQGRGDRCSIVVSQPRRISAFSIAERIASERLQKVGDEVGYSVRLDSKPGSHITLCTTGILLQMFLNNPKLDTLTYLVLDEIHERDINIDVAMALAKELLVTNKNIRIVLMSATLDAEKFSTYFGGAPVIQVNGETYPVSEWYLEDVEAVARHQGFDSPHFVAMARERDRMRSSLRVGIRGGSCGGGLIAPPAKGDYALVAFTVDHCIRQFDSAVLQKKSILVFLPGWKEILAAKNALERQRDDLHIILLHSTVEAAKQKQCFVPAPKGKVKVVLATNIAESGITIDDAAVVVDTGLIKLTSNSLIGRTMSSQESSGGDGQHSATQLSLIYASKANCTQRRGRAGRTQGGLCVRLFSRTVWDSLPAFMQPEILRVPLDQTVLRLVAMGYRDVQKILSQFIDPPSATAVARAVDSLRALDAITLNGQLTPLGLYLSLLPCEPRIGKMIVLGALMNCLDTVLTLAAAGEVNPFVSRRDLATEVRRQRLLFARGTESDHLAVVNAYNSFVANGGSRRSYADDHLLHWNNMLLISKYKKQFFDILVNAGLITDSNNYQHQQGEMMDEEETVQIIIKLGETTTPTTTNTTTTTTTTKTSAALATKSKTTRMPRNSDGGMWFVDRQNTSDSWNNVSLVKGCLAACLYPNVALYDNPLTSSQYDDGRQRRSQKQKRIMMRIRNGMILQPSKESACRRAAAAAASGNGNRASDKRQNGDDSLLAPHFKNDEEALWGDSCFSCQYLYQSVFKIQESNQTFLTSVSPVSAWALILFAAPLEEIRYCESLSLCCVGDWVVVHIDAGTLAIIRSIKQLLQASMMLKYQRPNHDDNNYCLRELRRLCSMVLHAPVTLIAQRREVTPVDASREIVPPWISTEELSSEERRLLETAAKEDDDDDDA